mmetsp:Transcript_810/g.1750  ORF Transcript_810/g.1750 Transcript_810/m.1750 type:complete len:187 (-) Transcript_810:2645-3205(-)
MESKPLVLSLIHSHSSGGFLALSQCPGKKLAMGRDGKPRNRDLAEDVENFARRGVRLLVCLLNPSELRSLGVQPTVYADCLEKSGIQLLNYPMIEMAAPGTVDEISSLLASIDATVTNGAGVLVHCRGGIGRAGTIAACYLLYKGVSPTAATAIDAVRRARDPRCVESRRQAEFISSYAKHLATLI